MENLGVKIECEAVEWEVILGRLSEQVPHLLIMGWAADYPDPDDFLRARIDHIQQQSGWRNAGYDSLVMQAQHSLDQGERLKLYEEAERILVEEAPIVPIFHMSVRLLVKPWVTRFPATGLRKWYFKDVIIKTL
jgi:oligopeptide transport system substrate-binding protein